jgi:hypothetical protein
MAVADLAEPGSLGRVLEGPGGTLAGIVEACDARDRPEVLAVRRVNAGIYALPAPEVFAYLARLSPDNVQGELYLTDALTAAAGEGRRIDLVPLADPDEALGVNDRAELARIHRLLIDRHLAALMRAGVTILEPARTVVEPGVTVGAETVIHPGVALLGAAAAAPSTRAPGCATPAWTTAPSSSPTACSTAPRWPRAAGWGRSPACGRHRACSLERGWATSSRSRTPSWGPAAAPATSPTSATRGWARGRTSAPAP